MQGLVCSKGIIDEGLYHNVDAYYISIETNLGG